MPGDFAADLRLAHLVHRLDGDGIVLEASKGTMVGHDHQYYCDIAMAPVPYAQALTMLLLLELEQGQWLA